MRVAGYTRVSSVEQVEGFSLAAQRHAITAYAAAQGWVVADWYEDAGRSAATDDVHKRPAFARMLADAEARRFDVVIVHGLDRFARSAVVALRTFAALREYRVDLVSIKERWDFTTPVGKLQFGIMAQLAEFYSANLSTEVKKGIGQKQREGGHHGRIPFGATRDRAGRLAIDPARADHLRTVYRLAAEHSDHVVAGQLNRAGIPAPVAAHWGARTIQFMRGVHGSWLLGQGDEWATLYRAARDRPSLPRVKPAGRVLMLTGLLRCVCGGFIAFGSERIRKDGTRIRRSWCRVAPGLPRCPIRSATAADLEARATAWLLALPDPHTLALRPVEPDAALAALAEDRRILARLYADRMIEDAEYEARRDALARRERALPPGPVETRRIGLGLLAMQAAWPDLPDPGRNAYLRTLVERFIWDGADLSPVWRAGMGSLFGSP